MKMIGVIPARYASSRFPGKPLADIHGKPMIWWVYHQAKKVPELEEVYIATDDTRIRCSAEELGCSVIMTSDKHPTGTDRVAEVADKIQADWYINIQGDEPLIASETIQTVLRPAINNEDVQVVSLMSKITDPVEALNPTIVKVIASESGRGVYLTRSISPFPKGSIDYYLYKHISVFAFSKSALSYFSITPRGRVECIEDIEMLRFIENGINVKFIEVDSKSVAVDTVIDLEKVRRIIKMKSEQLVGE